MACRVCLEIDSGMLGRLHHSTVFLYCVAKVGFFFQYVANYAYICNVFVPSWQKGLPNERLCLTSAAVS